MHRAPQATCSKRTRSWQLRLSGCRSLPHRYRCTQLATHLARTPLRNTQRAQDTELCSQVHVHRVRCVTLGSLLTALAQGVTLYIPHPQIKPQLAQAIQQAGWAPKKGASPAVTIEKGSHCPDRALKALPMRKLQTPATMFLVLALPRSYHYKPERPRVQRRSNSGNMTP